VGIGCKATLGGNLIELGLTGLGVDLADGRLKFGVFTVNQRLPSKSMEASWISWLNFDGEPCVQSLPSGSGRLLGELSSSGASYSVNTTRAASPDGRGRSFTFIELSPGPRARAR